MLQKLPALSEMLDLDVRAAYLGDPAATGNDEIIMCYPGFHALLIHRLAHKLHLQGVPLLPRMMAEHAHRESGIDIHPGATIGRSFFIDHGTGVVVGETTVIGDNVKMYQGVTLGALSFPTEPNGTLKRGFKRHPTIGDDVVIYSNASILGDVMIGKGSVIGGNVFLSHSVEPNSKVTRERPSLKIRRRRSEDE
jgi:serine O-acetyltransferase